MSDLTPDEISALAAKRTFMIGVLSGEDYLASRAQPDLAMPCHREVLLPLLRHASEAWAYALRPDSPALAAAQGILTPCQGKFRVALMGDPVTGHERFWNAGGGERGSIVLVLEATRFPTDILAYCQKVFIAGNPSVPHTPAAFRFASRVCQSANALAVMLTRSNGLQWISVHGEPALLAPLLALAKSQVRDARG